jgi:hypothetical protein
MGNEALKPSQLVVEFRSRLRIPVGEVDGSDQDSLNSPFDVAGLVIFRKRVADVSAQNCVGDLSPVRQVDEYDLAIELFKECSQLWQPATRVPPAKWSPVTSSKSSPSGREPGYLRVIAPCSC